MRIFIAAAPLFLFITCKSVPDASSTGKIMIRWTETYGSVCCPRDLQHENHIVDYIKEFEIQNNVKITGTYKIIKGREGEGTYYLTLDGLSEQQRMEFAMNRYPKYSKEAKRELVKKIEKPVDLKNLIKPWTLDDAERIN
ncbi:MAG: hypothetical protein HC811_10185 [Flammeovirgaceae bacterium]|nr:hypothetical protein [Flammeovirgaceae bacterium]